MEYGSKEEALRSLKELEEKEIAIHREYVSIRTHKINMLVEYYQDNENRILKSYESGAITLNEKIRQLNVLGQTVLEFTL